MGEYLSNDKFYGYQSPQQGGSSVILGSNSHDTPVRYPDHKVHRLRNLLFEGDARNRWRDGPVCPAVDKELWRLGPDGSAVRSVGCKCLPFLLVKSAREVPAFRFFPEKDKEEVSSVFTCNVKQTKEVLLEVAIDLGVEVNSTLTKSEIKNRICQSEDYNKESVKSLLEGILAEKREARELKERPEARELKERPEARELKERPEARELKERQEARELKERQEARELKERQEARELKERQETREYELERLRLSNATETVSVSSADLEGQGVNRRVNLKDLVPKFDAKNADINLFFEIFERQAIKEKVAEDRWVSQLIPLLPIEIAEIVAKEPLEKSDDYPHIKNLLLARFQLTPIALRDRFESHQRRPGAMWVDLVFELRSYLDNWLAGMKVGDFAALKELLVTEQIKKKEHQVN
ncbi:retrovirus-related Pol polyprotein from transposon 412 [Trichonephila clavipes]|nr:retrovirus-related Pol polyprotein from transposon 412 [Trichonephila clavipes]